MTTSEGYWPNLWRELSERFRWPETTGSSGWREDRARHFDEASKRKNAERPDPLRHFLLENLEPGHTVLDIGAGTGRFAVPMAMVAREVTAVEPSPNMSAILLENAAAEGVSNLRLVETGWEDADVEPHDVAFCSHAMYTNPDMVGFVRKMEAKARSACFLLMRVPSHDGILAELCTKILGQPHDSPNFVLGYNVLYSMGIYANVMMEPFMRPWTNRSLDDALDRARRHLRLGEDASHDDMIRETLSRRLTLRDGEYVWPDGMRSALAWWKARS